MALAELIRAPEARRRAQAANAADFRRRLIAECLRAALLACSAGKTKRAQRLAAKAAGVPQNWGVRETFAGACEAGALHLAMAIWELGLAPADAERALRKACGGGREHSAPTVRWLWSLVDMSGIAPQLLCDACHRDDLVAARLVWELGSGLVCAPPAMDHAVGTAFLAACSRGSLVVATWLHRCCPRACLTRDAFAEACARLDLPAVHWLGGLISPDLVAGALEQVRDPGRRSALSRWAGGADLAPDLAAAFLAALAAPCPQSAD